ncbi:MAG: YceI family protein [Gammaproteobacteria bacterium]|nr:YceI family protein [Gammaproteobacteria bacterium]
MFCSGLLAGFFLCSSAYAADYVIDSEKAHAFNSFKIQHLGYSWIKGRFNFIGESLQLQDDGRYLLQGQFTLHGVTNPLTIRVDKVGEGNDPWGGYRAGFEGEAHFTITDYSMDVTRLGPSSQQVYLTLSIEGIRQ